MKKTSILFFSSLVALSHGQLFNEVRNIGYNAYLSLYPIARNRAIGHKHQQMISEVHLRSTVIFNRPDYHNTILNVAINGSTLFQEQIGNFEEIERFYNTLGDVVLKNLPCEPYNGFVYCDYYPQPKDIWKASFTIMPVFSSPELPGPSKLSATVSHCKSEIDPFYRNLIIVLAIIACILAIVFIGAIVIINGKARMEKQLNMRIKMLEKDIMRRYPNNTSIPS